MSNEDNDFVDDTIRAQVSPHIYSLCILAPVRGSDGLMFDKFFLLGGSTAILGEVQEL